MSTINVMHIYIPRQSLGDSRHFVSFSSNPPIMSRIYTNYSLLFSVNVGKRVDLCVSEMGLLPEVLLYFSHFPKYIFSIGKTFIGKNNPPQKVVESLFISKLSVNCNQCICVFIHLTFLIYITIIIFNYNTVIRRLQNSFYYLYS